LISLQSLFPVIGITGNSTRFPDADLV
jgi:hypothetical protein